MLLVPHIVFLILTVLSHIGASLFFAKPRFNKVITAIIWMIYGIIFLILPSFYDIMVSRKFISEEIRIFYT